MIEATMVRAGTSVRGDIQGPKDVVVEGRLVGAVSVDGDLIVRAGGVVRGPIRARSVRVEGVVIGSIEAVGRIAVDADARISGNLLAPEVEVSDDARVRGDVARRPASPRTGTAVLWGASPASTRSLPKEPPADLLPWLGRSSGRMRLSK